MKIFTAVLISASAVPAWPASIPLRLHREISREFYSLGDRRVPSELRVTKPLPSDAVSAMATAPDGSVWAGTARGLLRYCGQCSGWDRTRWFAGKRYLPDDSVLALSVDQQGGVWVRTQTGVACLRFTARTLAAKAALFEEQIRLRHTRHGLVADSHLRISGDVKSNQTLSNDNDGLWTAMYGAAECFRYAVTHSSEALANAKRSVEAVLFLEQITGISGFPARSYVLPGEPKPAEGEWHRSPGRDLEWKGDTSSDEIVGHFFLYSIAFDLLPDPGLRLRIRAVTARIMDHIIGHGYELVGPDGQTTTWGKWSSRYFDTPGGRADSPLNALELLSFLATAKHITGLKKYAEEYRKAAFDSGYAALTIHERKEGEEINYSDEELAMLSFYALFQYERERPLLDTYRRALRGWWKNMEREKNPLWTLIYFVGDPEKRPDLPGAVTTLERIPLDLVDWTVRNSDRPDVTMARSLDRFQEPEAVTLLAPDERPIMRWNGNPFRVDGGSQGEREEEGTFFLLPYWLGRFQKIFSGQ